MSCESIVCPSGCTSNLPDFSFDLCNPDVHFGQVSDIFIGNINQPFVDINDPVEWSNRLALGENDINRIIQLQGIGDKPAAAENVVEISKGRKVSGPKDHTVNFRMDEVSDTNYNGSRKIECNKAVWAWFKTFEGKLYGGKYGVNRQGVSIRFNHVIPESAGELEILTGSITWKNMFHPCRTDWPLQGDIGGES